MDRFMKEVAFEQSMEKEFANLPCPHIPRIDSLSMPDMPDFFQLGDISVLDKLCLVHNWYSVILPGMRNE